MARLYHSGAEVDAGLSGSQTQSTDPDGQTQNVTRDTSVFRSGVASWKFNTGASNLVADAISSVAAFVDGNSYFLRGYFNTSAAPGSASCILGIGVSSPTTGIFARLRTDGKLELIANNAVQGSASTGTITDGTWHRVELKAVATATTTWTAAELLLDGVSVATWSGSVSRGTNIGWGYGLRNAEQPGANSIINVDDIAINDSTGAANTGYPGSGKVVLLKPTADSAVGTGWTNDNAASTGLFASVNSTPPVGIADTTSGGGGHQIRNATSNANVNYDATMTTYSAAGIAAIDTINAVIPWVFTAAPVTTGAKQGTVGVVSNPAISNVALSATGTAGAFWSGFAAGTFGGGWKSSQGTVSNAPSVTIGTAPVMRITQVTSSTRIAMCCFMGMYVDYTPGSAVFFGPKTIYQPAVHQAANY